MPWPFRESKSMTPARFRECLAVLRWSQTTLATELGVNERTVRRWASGANPVPGWVSQRLELGLVLHDNLWSDRDRV